MSTKVRHSVVSDISPQWQLVKKKQKIKIKFHILNQNENGQKKKCYSIQKKEQKISNCETKPQYK